MTTLANKKKKPIYIEALDFLIERLIKEQEEIIFQETYYKNIFLEHAIATHFSPMCIIRTYAEMLKASSRLTRDNTDLMHSNALLNYLRIFDDKDELEFINDLKYYLRDECCEKCKDQFPYLILKPEGRIKTFHSFEANERDKLLRFKILRSLNTSTMNSLQELFTKKASTFNNGTDFDSRNIFLDNEKSVKAYLQELLEQTVKKNSYSDLVGHRFIVYSVNHSTEESVLISYLYPLEEKIKEFFLNEGFFCSKRKDFVSEPKANGYQSIHLQFEIMQICVEFQIRTKRMHDIAEHGTAAHNAEYKDKKPMYISVKDMMRKFADKYGKTDILELLGFLEPLDTSNRPWDSTTEKIPYTPKDLKEFEDLDFIKSCLGMM